MHFDGLFSNEIQSDQFDYNLLSRKAVNKGVNSLQKFVIFFLKTSTNRSKIIIAK